MKIIPTNGYVLCKLINKEKEKVRSNGFVYEKDVLVSYKILKTDSSAKEKKFFEGDIVITNAIPTRVTIDDEQYFLLNSDNIASKIL